MGIRRLLTTSALAVATVLVAGAAPAAAAPHHAWPPRAMLQLMVMDGHNVAGALLSCDPTSGSHRNADKACGQLRSANGNFSQLSASTQPCILLYQPVTARAVGQWEGKRVNWKRVFGNSCALHAATGWVFRF